MSGIRWWLDKAHLMELAKARLIKLEKARLIWSEKARRTGLENAHLIGLSRVVGMTMEVRRQAGLLFLWLMAIQREQQEVKVVQKELKCYSFGRTPALNPLLHFC